MPCRAFLLAIVLLTLTPSIASAAPDRTKPTKPGTLRVTATTTTSVALAWGASTDNSGSVSYIVRESSGTTRASGPTSFTWTGLQPEPDLPLRGLRGRPHREPLGREQPGLRDDAREHSAGHAGQPADDRRRADHAQPRLGPRGGRDPL